MKTLKKTVLPIFEETIPNGPTPRFRAMAVFKNYPDEDAKNPLSDPYGSYVRGQYLVLIPSETKPRPFQGGPSQDEANIGSEEEGPMNFSLQA